MMLEIDNTDFGQLRQVVQLVTDRRMLRYVFVRMRHFCDQDEQINKY